MTVGMRERLAQLAGPVYHTGAEFPGVIGARGGLAIIKTLPHGRPGAFAWGWFVVAGIAGADLVLCGRAAISVSGWGELSLACGCIGVVALLYGLSGRSIVLSRMAHWSLLWILMSAACAVMTYATASLSGPSQDAALAQIDTALGFSWIGWHRFVCAHPVLRLALEIIYVTLMPQIIFTIFYCALTRQNRRNVEFFFLATGSLLASILVSWEVPALGASPFHGFPEEMRPLYLDELLRLRAHELHRVAFSGLKGLIVFPSFHTVLAILFPYVLRGNRRVSRCVLGLNLVLLVSIPVAGGHYLADMLGGAAVAAVAIVIARAAERLLSSGQGSGDEETLATHADLGSS